MLNKGGRKERIAIGFLIHRSGLDYDRRGLFKRERGNERDERDIAGIKGILPGLARRFEGIRIGDTRRAKEERRYRKVEPKVSEKDRRKDENEWRIVWSKQRRTPRGRLLWCSVFLSPDPLGSYCCHSIHSWMLRFLFDYSGADGY